MPNYVSKDGVWEPKDEKVALTDKNGEPYIYEGKDRGALEYLKEQGVEQLGINFREDPDVIMHARQLNMTVDEFCKTSFYTDKMRKEIYEKNKSEVVLHKPVVRKPASKQRSGGANTAGSGGLEGGMSTGGDPLGDAIRSAQQQQTEPAKSKR